MEYITIYEYVSEATNILQVIPLLIFIFLGFGMVFYLRKYMKYYSLLRQNLLFFGNLMLVIASIMIVVMLIRIPEIISQERKVKNAIRQKNYKVVEGKIEKFSNYEESGHIFESFIVRDVNFVYSGNILGKGFNHTTENNGPILKIRNEDRKVRISYISQDNENLILKLEVEGKEE
jgi:predicted membrane protein